MSRAVVRLFRRGGQRPRFGQRARRAGIDSPLRIRSRHEAPKTCPSRWLSTPRRRRSGRNATSQTRSPPSDGASPSLSPAHSIDVHAVTHRDDQHRPNATCDAVVLDQGSEFARSTRARFQSAENAVLKRLNRCAGLDSYLQGRDRNGKSHIG